MNLCPKVQGKGKPKATGKVKPEGQKVEKTARFKVSQETRKGKEKMYDRR